MQNKQKLFCVRNKRSVQKKN